MFQASSHVARFADFMVRDTVKHENCFRADKLVAEFLDAQLALSDLPTSKIQEYSAS